MRLLVVCLFGFVLVEYNDGRCELEEDSDSAPLGSKGSEA